ncbi:UDP-N-acetylmuramoylalanine--D-glutamate ligase [Candidatus Magnetomoraceae bacterium gMMP-15]
MKIKELSNKSVVILGMGIEGIGTLKYLLSVLPDKKIGIADVLEFNNLKDELKQIINMNSNIQVHCGNNYLTEISKYEVLIKSAGIPLNLLNSIPFFSNSTIITCQTSLFFSNYKGTIIAVTGTKGKSTTVSIIYSILTEAGLNANLVGNIGVSALSEFTKNTNDSIFIYELSSFQLELFKQNPKISILLNIMPEHLDFHGNFSSYCKAKTNIFRYQSANDYLIFNDDCKVSSKLICDAYARNIPFSVKKKLYPGIIIDDNMIIEISSEGNETFLADLKDINLLGHFNLNNIIPAITACRLLNVPPEKIKKGLNKFVSLEHRLEFVGSIHGITFYNDSIATVPQATIAAIETLGPKVETLITGGNDRGINYKKFADFLAKSHLINIILFPTTGEKILNFIKTCNINAFQKKRFFQTMDMSEAVSLAYRYTKKDCICLLSPAASSFGCFNDFKERGNLFKKYVFEIRGKYE